MQAILEGFVWSHNSTCISLPNELISGQRVFSSFSLNANQSHDFKNWNFWVVTLHFCIKLLSFLAFYLPICFSFFFVCLFVCLFFSETNLQTYCYADNNSTVDHLDNQFLKYNQRHNEKLSKEAQQSKV